MAVLLMLIIACFYFDFDFDGLGKLRLLFGPVAPTLHTDLSRCYLIIIFTVATPGCTTYPSSACLDST